MTTVQVALAIAYSIIATAPPHLKAILDLSPLTDVSVYVIASLLRAWSGELHRSNVVGLLALANLALQIGKICLNKHSRNSGDLIGNTWIDSEL